MADGLAGVKNCGAAGDEILHFACLRAGSFRMTIRRGKETSKEPLRFVRPPGFRRTFRFRFRFDCPLRTGSAYRAPWRVYIISQITQDVKRPQTSSDSTSVRNNHADHADTGSTSWQLRFAAL
jgi:hypothetical protein